MEALKVLQNRKYDVLDSTVEDIHIKCIRMDHAEKQALVERFQRVIYNFINRMKAVDPLFSQIFNRLGFTGSFYDGLRVGEATEYDLNLILKPKLKIKTSKDGCPAGFISVIVEERYDSLPKHYKSWMKPCECGGNCMMDPKRVRDWLQGVVQRTLTQIRAAGDLFQDCEIKIVRQSGPAWTLDIVSHQHPMKSINVDLVPVLEFPYSQWPVDAQHFGGFRETWFVVPKPPRYSNSTNWRLSFPKQEKEIISRLEYLKYTLRLLKRVRDQFEYKALASYYIKTLFLWEVKRQNRSIWVNSRRGRLFIYMLIRLKDALEAGEIPFFWDEDCNLIEDVNSACLRNFSGRLRRFLHDIDVLIDQNNYEQLQSFISGVLSTPSEQKAEQEAAEQSSCTIL